MSRFPELFEEAIELVVERRGAPRRAPRREHREGRRRAPGSASRGGLDPCPVADSSPNARDRPRDPGDGDAVRDRRRFRDRDATRSRRRGDRNQRLPVRTGSRAQPRIRAPARGRVRHGRRRADPRARPDRDPQPARAPVAVRRNGAGSRRRGPRRRCRTLDERTDLRPPEAAGRALRRRARAPSASLRRGLRALRAPRRPRHAAPARRRRLPPLETGQLRDDPRTRCRRRALRHGRRAAHRARDRRRRPSRRPSPPGSAARNYARRGRRSSKRCSVPAKSRRMFWWCIAITATPPAMPNATIGHG